jgi:tetratricopeptide (TPR) repeat protein
MMQGVDPQVAERLNTLSAKIEKNPKDIDARNERAAYALGAAAKSRYQFFWVYAAAKDLEIVLAKQPNNWVARHNYGDAAYRMGDMGTDQSVMRLSVFQFTKAIELNPKSARSYMGRGWAYGMLNDEAHANADYKKALQLDPTLRAELERTAQGNARKRAQLGAAQRDLERLGRYYVEKNARTQEGCVQNYRGYWTQGECRMSTAFSPFP